MDTDALRRTLDAIDAVTVCGWCQAPLTADSSSPNYCCEEHQERWLARYASSPALPLTDDHLVDAHLLREELQEARRIWNDRRQLTMPALLSEVLEEVFEEILRSQPAPVFFTPPTPAELQNQRLARIIGGYGSIDARLHDPRSILRSISTAC
jgi:hypothetical protein